MTLSVTKAEQPRPQLRLDFPFLDENEPYIYLLLTGQSNAKGFTSAFGETLAPNPDVEAWDDDSGEWVIAELGKDPFNDDNIYTDRGLWQSGQHYYPTLYHDRGIWSDQTAYGPGISYTDRGLWGEGNQYNALDEVQDSLGRAYITYVPGTGLSEGDYSHLTGGSDQTLTWLRKGYPERVAMDGSEKPEVFVTYEGGISSGDNTDLASGSDTGVTWLPSGRYEYVDDGTGAKYLTNKGGVSDGNATDLLGGSDTAIEWLPLSHPNNIAYVLGQGLAKYYGKKVRLLKPAWGANPIENWISDLSPEIGESPGYVELNENDAARPDRWSQIMAQLEAANIPRLDLVVWMQLESNSARAVETAKEPDLNLAQDQWDSPDNLRAGSRATDAHNNDLYRARLKAVIERFRTSMWGRADLPFIACQGVQDGNQDDRNSVIAELSGDPDAHVDAALTRERKYPLPDYTPLGLPDRINRDLDQKYPGPDSVDFAHHSAFALTEIAQRVLDKFIKMVSG